MPDMMSLHQPHHNSMLLSPIKESPRHCDRFPEYLKNTDVLGDANHKLKLTASNSLFHAVLKVNFEMIASFLSSHCFLLRSLRARARARACVCVCVCVCVCACVCVCDT